VTGSDVCSSDLQIRSGESLRVPAGYKDAVAEYFRRLSQNH